MDNIIVCDADGIAIGHFNTFRWWDGVNIEDFEIYPEYRGKGYAYKLLDVAVKQYGVRNLAVTRNNTIAYHTYYRYGFRTMAVDDAYLYMSITD